MPVSNVCVVHYSLPFAPLLPRDNHVARCPIERSDEFELRLGLDRRVFGKPPAMNSPGIKTQLLLAKWAQIEKGFKPGPGWEGPFL